MTGKYHLPKFLEFLSVYEFKSEKAEHTARIAYLYYDLAYHQMISLHESCSSFFKVEEPAHDEINDSLHRSWAFAYGMYALMRTAMDGLRIMRQMEEDLTAVDTYWETEITRLVNIANDIVKHPTFKAVQSGSLAVEPQALQMNCEIDVVFWSEKGFQERRELDPMHDFNMIHDYFEYIGIKLLSFNSM